MTSHRLYTPEELNFASANLGKYLHPYHNVLFVMNASFLLANRVMNHLSSDCNILFYKPGVGTPPKPFKGSFAIVDLLFDTGATHDKLMKEYKTYNPDFFCLLSKSFDKVPFKFPPLPAPNAFLWGFGLDDRKGKRTNNLVIFYETL